MKYHLACLSAILALMYGNVLADDDYDDLDDEETIVVSDESTEDVASEDYSDAETVIESDESAEDVASEDYSDAKTVIESDESFEDDSDDAKESEDSVDDRKEQQKALLEENESGKNYGELEVLLKNGFVVTKKSLADLEKKFNSAVTRVDLFESVNMNSALLGAFNFALNEEADTNFIVGEYDLPKNIKEDSDLFDAMQEFIENLNDTEGKEKDIRVKNLESLKNIYNMLTKNKTIGENNVFSKFVKGMINVYQVLIARETAEEIMSKNRSKTEDRIISTRKSSSLGAGGRANMGAAKLGASASYHKDEGSDDSSFYTVSVGGGARLSVGAGIASIGAELGISADVTKSAVFFSLEQLLDSGKIKAGVLSSKSLKQILKSRQKMQARERELLSIFGKDVEGYLKMIGIIPVSTYIEWPKLTKSSPSDESKTVSKAVDATVSAFEMLGFNVVANDDIKTWRRPSGYMTLISDDCSPSDGLTSDDIVNFLGKQYDRLDALEEELKKNDEKNDENEVISLRSFISSMTTLDEFTSKESTAENESERTAYQFVLTTILGDIRAYNSVLNILAENKSDKKAEKRKHGIEKRWLSKHKFSSEGRLGVLKSMIATVSVLRGGAKFDREIELFKQLHSEMDRLAKLLEFSKSKSSRSGTFMSETTAHNSAVQASASILIPKFGEAQFSINRSWIRDNPLQDENGYCQSIDIVLPLTPMGVVGTGSIHESLNNYRRLTGQSPASGFGNTFDLVQDGFDLVQDNLMIPEVSDLKIAGSISGNMIISFSSCQVDAADAESLEKEGVRKLPGKNKYITKDKSEFALWYIKMGAYLNSSLERDFDLAELSYASSVGKEKIIIGTDTFGYLTSRFDAFSLGLKDSKDAISPWYAFKDKHRDHLMALLENIANEESNIIFELQGMYSTIMDNIGEKDKKTSKKCTQLFENFISACEKLANAKNKENAFKKASELLDQVLQMNFDYSFMVNYNKVYSIKK